MLQMARGAMAKTQLCFGWLSELAVREHIEHGALLARIMQFLSDENDKLTVNFVMTFPTCFLAAPVEGPQLKFPASNLLCKL